MTIPTSPTPDPREYVAVSSGHPHHPSFAYTRGGVAHRGAGLITFQRDAEFAARIVAALAGRPPGHVRADGRHLLDVRGEELLVRLDACAPTSAARFALWRHDDHPEPRYLQVHVVTGPRGSFEVDTCDCCPDLARTGVVWRAPFEVRVGDDEHEPLLTLLDADGGRTLTVDVPVRDAAGDVGRLERIAATPVGEGRVRLLQAPVLADWTTAGAVLALSPDGEVTQVGANARVHLAVRTTTTGPYPEHSDAARVTTERLAALPGTAVTNTGPWLAAAVLPAQAQRARSLLRRLVRDGHASEVGTFHAPAPHPESCASCRAGLPALR